MVKPNDPMRMNGIGSIAIHATDGASMKKMPPKDLHHGGVIFEAGSRNYEVVDLSPDNTVVYKMLESGRVLDSGEKPSALGLDGFTRPERAILRRGLTAGGRDRARPKPA